jgi:AraC-like DNA-binding protein
VPPTTHFAPRAAKLSNGSRLGTTPVISVTALAGIPAFVRHAFGDRLLRRANQAALLDIEAIEDQDCFIPQITMTTFLDAVAKLSGEQDFGLMVAPYLTIASYGCWGEYLLAAPTLGAAVERAIATFGFHSKGDRFSITSANGRARLSYASAAKGKDGYQHVACGAAGVIVSLCKSFLSPQWRPHCIELDIPRPPRSGVFEDVFQCAVVFEASECAVSLDANCLHEASPIREPRSPTTFDDVVRARVECLQLNTLTEIVIQQIWSQVLTGEISIESAARSLGTSVRTLQRELNREGTDFRTMANAMRTRRAIELLGQTNGSVTNISMVLGYSAPAHFARAFHKATGLSPKSFRQRMASANAL